MAEAEGEVIFRCVGSAELLGTEDVMEKAKMDKAFELVDPAKRGARDWKERISAWVREHELEAAGLTIEEVAEAVVFFTATEPKVEKMTMYDGTGYGFYVTAKGSRAGPAGP